MEQAPGPRGSPQRPQAPIGASLTDDDAPAERAAKVD